MVWISTSFIVSQLQVIFPSAVPWPRFGTVRLAGRRWGTAGSWTWPCHAGRDLAHGPPWIKKALGCLGCFIGGTNWVSDCQHLDHLEGTPTINRLWLIHPALPLLHIYKYILCVYFFMAFKVYRSMGVSPSCTATSMAQASWFMWVATWKYQLWMVVHYFSLFSFLNFKKTDNLQGGWESSQLKQRNLKCGTIATCCRSSMCSFMLQNIRLYQAEINARRLRCLMWKHGRKMTRTSSTLSSAVSTDSANHVLLLDPTAAKQQSRSI